MSVVLAGCSGKPLSPVATVAEVIMPPPPPEPTVAPAASGPAPAPGVCPEPPPRPPRPTCTLAATCDPELAAWKRAVKAWERGLPACRAGMVPIPGGRYTLGERGDTVTVAAFWLDATEVTVDAYTACVKAGRCTDDRLRCGEYATYGVTGKGNHPINCVDWDQADTYCRQLGKRLPTEEEWEWAARGGPAGTKYPWGNAAPSSQICWRRWDNSLGTCAVGSFPAGDSPQGVADLAGNVSEWTQSVEEVRHRVSRGGTWDSETVEDVRISYRSWVAPTIGGNSKGFRCARSP